MSKDKDGKFTGSPKGRNHIEPHLLQSLLNLPKFTIYKMVDDTKGDSKKWGKYISLGESDFLLVDSKQKGKPKLLGMFKGSSEEIGDYLEAGFSRENRVSISIDARLTPTKFEKVLNVLGNYYRACGGDGLIAYLEHEDGTKAK